MAHRARSRRLAAAVAMAAIGGALVWGVGEASDVTARPDASSSRSDARPRAHAQVAAIAPATSSPAGEDAGVAGDPIDELTGPCRVVRTVGWGGRSIAGALVLVRVWPAREHEGSPAARELRTDARGEATLCVPAERAVSIGAWDDEGRGAQRSGVWSGAITDPLVLHLVEPTSVAGTVTDEHGRALAGASLFLERVRWDPDGGPLRPGTGDFNLALTGQQAWRTDAHGRFEIPLERAVLVQVRAEAPGHRPGAAGPVAARAEDRVELALVLAPGAVMRGTVRDESQPVAGARIALRELGTGVERGSVTDEEGRFTIDGIDPEGRFDIHVSSDGHLELREWALAPGEHAFELVRAGVVELTAIAREAAEVCGPAQVHATPDTRPWRTVVGALGSPIRMAGLPRGAVDIEISALGSVVRREVEVRPGETVALRVHLEPPGAALLIVRRLGGGPVSAELVGASGESTWIDVRDDVACTTLEPGRYRLDHGGVTPLEVDLAPGGVQTVEVPPRRLAPPRCVPDLSARRNGRALLVTVAGPDAAPLLPGDQIVRADDETRPDALAMALEGDEDTFVTVRVQRPDGSEVEAPLRRERCRR